MDNYDKPFSKTLLKFLKKRPAENLLLILLIEFYLFLKKKFKK